ncbi:hypothetical protein GGI12_006357, partial [Dipsacomyces acuminosporus]
MPNTAWLRLMECRYARSTYPECLGSVVRGYSPQEITRANQDSMLALGLVGICEFISYAEAFVPSEALYTCLKAAIDAHVEPFVRKLEAAKALVHPDGSGNWVVVLNEQGIDSLAGLELALSENGCKAWGMTGGLLFSPAIYSGHEAGAAVAKYLQTQFLDAVHILNTSSPFSWAQKLGLPETAPPFAEDDMRQVGNMITYYLEN